MKFLKQLPTVSILSMKSVDEMERFLTDESISLYAVLVFTHSAIENDNSG